MDYEIKIADLDIEVPVWINQDITASDIMDIIQGGCDSGAYMPAVRYYDALQTMAKYGDEVTEYILDYYGELPDLSDKTWSEMAVTILSFAVELWASSIESEIEEKLEEMFGE